MTHQVWPLFDLRVVTPRLELRYVDDTLAVDLALLARDGVHDPAFMPFAIAWTDAPTPQMERNAMQFHWRTRADTTPRQWNINFAVLVDGHVVGSSGLMATDFPTLRQFETGSWLGRRFQGQGLGTEMRIATLQVGFDGFGAEWATTSAFEDNGPSLGVTRKLGYSAAGHRRAVSRDTSRRLELYELGRADFAARLRRDDIELHGVEPCRELLGLSGSA